MIVQRFVKWCETASNGQRAEGIAILARGLLEDRVPKDEVGLATSVLVLALDDPSPNVRTALADVLGMDPRAPRPLVRSLLLDNEAIALRVARSPALLDSDLAQAFLSAPAAVQAAIAARRPLSTGLAGLIADNGGREACVALLEDGEAASLSRAGLAQIAERFGDDSVLRLMLIARADLPTDVRQTLILEHASALQASPFISAVLGRARTHRLVFEMCERATATMAENLQPHDIPVLAEHLRISGQISTAFLIRLACAGNVDLFAAALTTLSGMPERRVRAVVVEGRPASFDALLRDCGLQPSAAALLRTAIQTWKDVVAGRIGSNADDLPELVMNRVVERFRRRPESKAEGIAALLDRLENETWRESARFRAQRLLAA